MSRQRSAALALPSAPYLRRIVLITDTGRDWASTWDSNGPTVPPDVLAAAEAEVSPADLAVMVHTSGSTADPKGVLHTHGTLVRQTSMWPAAIEAVTGSPGPARILCAMPFFWIGGLLAAMGALHEPITLLVLPRLEPAGALDLVETERATGIVGWPAFTQRLREHPSFTARDLSSVPMLRDGPLDIAMTDVPDGYPVHRTMSETAGGFVHTELGIVDEEVVDAVDLSGAGRTGRRRDREPHLRVVLPDVRGDGALADRGGPGHDDEPARTFGFAHPPSNRRTSSATWFVPSPPTRRDCAMPISSMI